MVIDPKWLEFLKLPPKATIVLAMSSTAIIILDKHTGLDLDSIHKLLSPFVFIIAVVSYAMIIATIGEILMRPQIEKRKQSTISLRREIRRNESKKHQNENEQKILLNLDHLSAEEIHHISRCLRKGSPTFYGSKFDPAITMLLGKRLAWSLGGTYSRNNYPFSIHHFVWVKLLERREEFIALDDSNKPTE